MLAHRSRRHDADKELYITLPYVGVVTCYLTVVVVFTGSVL